MILQSYTRKFYEPYKNWQELIWKIDREPQEQFQKCENNKSNLDSLLNTINKKKKYLDELIVINSNVKKSLEKIKAKKLELTPTCN